LPGEERRGRGGEREGNLSADVEHRAKETSPEQLLLNEQLAEKPERC